MSNLELEVFRAGDYGAKGTWDDAALDRLAADYDPTLHEAPVTLDHAQDGPAHGWVSGLRRAGDKLVANLRGLSTQLLDLLKSGSFKKRSVEIYPDLRETGRPYLRAVSFLGAAVPEVKGLADAATTEGGHSCPPQSEPLSTTTPVPLFANAEQPWTAFDDEAEPAFTEIATEPPSNIAAAVHASADTPGSADALVGRSEGAPPSHETQPAAAETNATPPIPFAEVIANLKTTGKWHPAWLERGIEHFYEALAQLPAITNLSQALSPAAWFTEFLEALPPAVVFEPIAAPRSTTPAHAFLAPLQFSETLPGGPPIAPHSLALHRAALAIQHIETNLSYTEALLRAAR